MYSKTCFNVQNVLIFATSKQQNIVTDDKGNRIQ